MKKTISILFLFCFLFLMLRFPTTTVKASASGLMLWYQTLLPTLLPFTILANILISSGYFLYLGSFFYRFLHFIYPINQTTVFPLVAGLLFGFPLGSKITADLVKQNELSTEEGNILICISNSFSPAFISSYFIKNSLGAPKLTFLCFLILYLPPLVFGYFKLNTHKTGRLSLTHTKKPASRSQLNFKIIDTGILNGFETLTKLGGYIMLFSILAAFIMKLPIKNPAIKVLSIGALEATTGIHAAAFLPSFPVKFCIMILFTAFGGLSGIAQTASMIKETNLSIRYYVTHKLLFAGISTLLAGFITYLY